MDKKLYECEWRQYPKDPNIAVSNDGRVLSYKSGKLVELKPNNNGYGYLRIGIGHENPVYIHRLVAETYIDNPCPESKTQVNHIDGNKSNNSVSNLEWCTPSENEIHAFKNGLKRPSPGKPVSIVETGETFISIAECARHINGVQANIVKCLNGERHTHRGYHFTYVEEVVK